LHVSAADPLNLSGILFPGARVSTLSEATLKLSETVLVP
jgi:hypothetical protein